MKLSLDEFFDIIKEEQEDYVVKLAYKYHWEEDYTISNELLEWDSEDYVWVNDWNEGQDFVYVIGFIKVSDVNVPEYEAEWKLVDAYRHLFECSNCKQQSINRYKYCMWCGQKMKGVQ